MEFGNRKFCDVPLLALVDTGVHSWSYGDEKGHCNIYMSLCYYVVILYVYFGQMYKHVRDKIVT